MLIKLFACIDCILPFNIFGKIHYRQTGRIGTCVENMDRVPQTRAMQIKRLFRLWVPGPPGGRARQEIHAGMTLLSPSLLAGNLCPYSPRMSRYESNCDLFFNIFGKIH